MQATGYQFSEFLCPVAATYSCSHCSQDLVLAHLVGATRMHEGLALRAGGILLQLMDGNTRSLGCFSMLMHAWASVQVQDLVAELARVRRNKIQAGLRELQSALSAVKLLNLGYMEVNQIRPFFKGSLDRFFRLLPACPALAPCL